MVSTRTLIRVAAVGGVVVSATGFYLQSRITDRVRSYDYYKAGLRTLRRHAGAVHFLGEPIKDRTFKLSDAESNFCDGKVARLKVPVSGPKGRGTYYFWASRVDGEWKIDRAELELKNQPDKLLVIVKSQESPAPAKQ